MQSDKKIPPWSPKVQQSTIRRLYERDAQGIIDSDLIDEVGWALWGRCDSILTVTAAHYGRVTCPSCSTAIERQNLWSENEIVACANCGWNVPWQTYHQSYRTKQLFGANAVDVFEIYHQAFPKAQAEKEKMMLIDRLIHSFHTNLKEITGRPVAANLIQGSLKEVIQFLDALTNGEASATGIGDMRATWKQTLVNADWSKPFIGNQSDSEET